MLEAAAEAASDSPIGALYVAQAALNKELDWAAGWRLRLRGGKVWQLDVESGAAVPRQLQGLRWLVIGQCIAGAGVTPLLQRTQRPARPC